jgi:hypothetical protein
MLNVCVRACQGTINLTISSQDPVYSKLGIVVFPLVVFKNKGPMSLPGNAGMIVTSPVSPDYAGQSINVLLDGTRSFDPDGAPLIAAWNYVTSYTTVRGRTVLVLCHVHVCMTVCVSVCLYVCMHACASAYLFACMCVCMHVRVPVCMYVCMYRVCMYVCMYVCMCVFMFVCMYTCLYVCVYVCMYLCLYVYMYLLV